MVKNFEFFDTSNVLTITDKDGAKPRVGEEKYPWRNLPVGKSFFIPKEDNVKLKTIQSSCSRWSKKLGRNFKCVKHEAGIEVARLPDIVGKEEAETVEPVKPKTSFFE